MLRRIDRIGRIDRVTALGLGLVLLAGCGEGSAGPVSGYRSDPPATVAGSITTAEAEQAFEMLGDLADAWRHEDCTKIEFLTTWAERDLGGRLCQAVRNGRPAPELDRYSDPDVLLPGEGGDDDSGTWFAVLARRPEPAYFVFVRSEDRWRLGAGPIPVVDADPVGSASLAEGNPATSVRMKLVPTRHVAFLVDPTGVSGVKFVPGDPMHDLLRQLARAPGRARPDRLTIDVRIEGDARGLALPEGAGLVFHVVRIVYTQRPGPGRTSLAHPRYGTADLRAFTGKSGPQEVTGSELVLLATRVTRDNRLSTVAMRRVLADITTVE